MIKQNENNTLSMGMYGISPIIDDILLKKNLFI